MDETIFSKIIRGDIPCYKVAENDQFFAFLDINPLAKGHTLVVPKKVTDYIFDIDDEELGQMICFAKKVAKAIKANYDCSKIGMTVIGLEVPHAHIHLVPINGVNDIDFRKPKLNFTEEEFKEIAFNISQSIR